MSNEKLSNEAESPALNKGAVMCRYFRCRFFKGQTLTAEIFEASDEADCKKQFKKKHRTLNLLECVQI